MRAREGALESNDCGEAFRGWEVCGGDGTSNKDNLVQHYFSVCVPRIHGAP